MKISESSVKVWQCSRTKAEPGLGTPGRELNDWDRPARWADEYAGRTDTRDQRDARGLGLPADGLRRPDGLRGAGDRISFKMFRYSQFKRRT